LGNDTEQFWDSCLKGKSVVDAVPETWAHYSDMKSRIWSPLPPTDYSAWGLTRIEQLQLDPASLLTICAAHEAIENAQLVTELREKKSNTFNIRHTDPTQFGVFMGTGVGGLNSLLENHCHPVLARQKAKLKELRNSSDLPDHARATITSIIDRMHHPLRVNPFVASMFMPNAFSAVLGIKFSLTGENTTSAGACAAGTIALGRAFRAIQSGTVNIALAGGADYLEDYFGYIFRGFDVAGTLVRNYDTPETANRPFDKRRSGFLFSQGGAAVLVLEDFQHAQQRGAPILAEIIGYAESFDAHSMMSIEPSGDQIERMIRSALRDAGIDAGDVNYVNAHATGTQNNDAIEARVLRRIFGKSVLVNSTKSLTGHVVGASGALEALISVLSLKYQKTHPCLNLEDPVEDLNFVQSARSHDMSVALSQSFAFGGHNAGIVMRRVEA
jgi:3-oxoacyl-[acyl-carrier-protein] synthase II